LLKNQKIIVVLPAYNAARTLERTVQEIPRDIVDEILLVDDASTDETTLLSQKLDLTTFQHKSNFGYGRNQKTCYREALNRQADIIIMLHPDYQYSPHLIAPMAAMLTSGEYDVVLESRILGVGALAGGMPLYKYVFNRLLTAFQNLFLNYKLSEYHTGFRGFRREVLETLPLEANSDDFVFDNEMLVQSIYFNFRVGEISCPTRYFAEASSINFSRSVRYGLAVLATSVKFLAQKLHLTRFRIFEAKERHLVSDYYQQITRSN
jgi:glycosyltransferase involved in cell wall biosynthesis